MARNKGKKDSSFKKMGEAYIARLDFTQALETADTKMAEFQALAEKFEARDRQVIQAIRDLHEIMAAAASDHIGEPLRNEIMDMIRDACSALSTSPSTGEDAGKRYLQLWQEFQARFNTAATAFLAHAAVVEHIAAAFKSAVDEAADAAVKHTEAVKSARQRPDTRIDESVYAMLKKEEESMAHECLDITREMGEKIANHFEWVRDSQTFIEQANGEFLQDMVTLGESSENREFLMLLRELGLRISGPDRAMESNFARLSLGNGAPSCHQS